MFRLGRQAGLLALAATAAGLAVAASAGATPSAVDLQLDIAVGEGTVSSSGLQAPIVPNGGSVTVRGLNFHGGPIVSLVNPEAASAKVRFQLPAGLGWGSDLPDPTEQCTSTASAGECQTPSLQPITGGTDYGWAWDIVAAQPGTYVLQAEIAEASPSDPVPANNRSSVTVVVTEASAGGGSGTAVAVGAVSLAPARPKAGSVVRATVRVTVGGKPARPRAVSCSGTIGSSKASASATTTVGTATCTYRTPKAARGKVLRGSVFLSAGGKRFTKRFSTRLG